MYPTSRRNYNRKPRWNLSRKFQLPQPEEQNQPLEAQEEQEEDPAERVIYIYGDDPDVPLMVVPVPEAQEEGAPVFEVFEVPAPAPAPAAAG